MVDLSDKVSDQASETEEMSGQTPSSERISSSSGGTNLKTCADCGTTKTPLWRGGPAGPKSLCNACGIRSRKKRRALLCPNKEDKKLYKSSSMKQNSNQSNNTSSSSSSTGSGNIISRLDETQIKRTFLGFGGNVFMQRPRSSSTSQRRRRIGEVEQAAFLLMALSCGTVYA